MQACGCASECLCELGIGRGYYALSRSYMHRLSGNDLDELISQLKDQINLSAQPGIISYLQSHTFTWTRCVDTLDMVE